MKIIKNFIPRVTLEQLCATHDLTIEVNERHHIPEGCLSRYYAHFRGVEIMEGGMLIGSFSNGSTPEAAIGGLKNEFSDKRLVTGAHTSERREFGPYVIVDSEP